MNEIIKGHLVDCETWDYFWNYERWIFFDDKAANYYNAYLDTPSKKM